MLASRRTAAVSRIARRAGAETICSAWPPHCAGAAWRRGERATVASPASSEAERTHYAGGEQSARYEEPLRLVTARLRCSQEWTKGYFYRADMAVLAAAVLSDRRQPASDSPAPRRDVHQGEWRSTATAPQHDHQDSRDGHHHHHARRRAASTARGTRG